MPASEQRVLDDGRYERWVAQLEAVSRPHGTKVMKSLEDAAPRLGCHTVEFAYASFLPDPART